MTYREALRAFQVQYWSNILTEHGGNITQAARAAGINRTDLHKRLQLLVKSGMVYEPRQQGGNWGDLSDITEDRGGEHG